MRDVPKFVRQRAAQTAAGEHPETNLLGAFAEGGLTRRERAEVLAHLGACAECREIMSLALPEVPAAAATPVATVKPWRRWPMLRWAGVVAAVVVVAAAVMIQKSYWRETPSPAQPRVATESAAKPQEGKPSETAGGAKANAAAPGKKLREVAPGNKSNEKDVARAAPANDTLKAKVEKKQGAIAGFANNEPKRMRDEGRMDKAPATLDSAGGAAAAQTRSLPLQSAQPQMKAKATAAGAGEFAGQAPSQSGTASRLPPQAAPAPRASTESVEVAAEGSPRPLNKAHGGPVANLMLTASRVRWRVSSEGALERSGDGGRSWQTVRVGDSTARFRAVASMDGDVWVGGAEGALYHSADGGLTWKRVPVVAEDMVLATDIARVEFKDAQHGSVTTKDGVTWVTNDAGATWAVR